VHDAVLDSRRAVKISKPLVEAMFAHARESNPRECCGLLAGLHGIPSQHYRMQNVHPTPEVFFEMAPTEQFAVTKDIRHQGLQLVAIYHSHPKSPARPSESDIRLAYDSELFYLLISLQQQDTPQLRAYRIVEGTVTEEPVEVSPG